jgi:hypothetical protein
VKIEGMKMKDIESSHWMNGIEGEEGIMKVNRAENEKKIMNVSLDDFNSSLSFFMMNKINAIDCDVEKLIVFHCKSEEGSFFSLYLSFLPSSLSNLPSSLSFPLTSSSFPSVSSFASSFPSILSSYFPSFHLKDENFSSSFPPSTNGSSLSLSSSSSLSLVSCAIEGTFFFYDDNEIRKDEEVHG